MTQYKVMQDLPAQLCADVTAELGRWARICLGTNRVEVQDMFKMMYLCFVHSGREVRMDRLLGEKYHEQMQSVREERRADWSHITVVKMLPWCTLRWGGRTGWSGWSGSSRSCRRYPRVTFLQCLVTATVLLSL